LNLSRDGWGGLAVLAASLFLFALTLDLKDNPLVPIGPGFYPRIVLGLTAVLAAALVAFDLLRKQKPAAAGEANYGAVVLHFAVFGLYVLALPELGFRVATVVYIAAANALLEWPKTAKGWARVAAVAFIAMAVVYLVFEHYLTVLLPRGRWTGF
jgi:putative tricarboxylic transport membrane protein